MKTDQLRQILSFAADGITIIAILILPLVGFFYKKKSVIGFRINQGMNYLLKSAIIAISLLIVYRLSSGIYIFILLISKGDATPIYWEPGYALHHLLSYFVSIAIGVVLFWYCSLFIWNFSLSKYFSIWRYSSFANNNTPKLIIDEAIYGTNAPNPLDVTYKVRQMITNETLKIKFTNQLAGDPARYVVKDVRLVFRFEGTEPIPIALKEHDEIEIFGPDNYKIIPGQHSQTDNDLARKLLEDR